jgi:hypothetical protein
MKIQVEITLNKRHLEVNIQDGIFTQHTVLPRGKSLATSAARCIAKYFRDSGFLD